MNVADSVTEADLAAHWGVKACKVCKTVKPRTDFDRHADGIMGLTTSCKRCRYLLYRVKK